MGCGSSKQKQVLPEEPEVVDSPPPRKPAKSKSSSDPNEKKKEEGAGPFQKALLPPLSPVGKQQEKEEVFERAGKLEALENEKEKGDAVTSVDTKPPVETEGEPQKEVEGGPPMEDKAPGKYGSVPMNPAMARMRGLRAQKMRSTSLYSARDGLHVKVLQAKCLDPAKEKTGVINPYVEIQLRDFRDKKNDSKKTKVIKNNPNPAWNEIFRMFPKGMNNRIIFKVYSYHSFGSDKFFGQYEMPLSLLPPDQQKLDIWGKLETGDRSELHVQMKWVPLGEIAPDQLPANRLTPKPFELPPGWQIKTDDKDKTYYFDATNNVSTYDPPPQNLKDPRVKDAVENAQKFALPLRYTKKLSMKIVCAKGIQTILKKSKEQPSTNPYVTIDWGFYHFKSNHVMETFSPSWDFDVEMNMDSFNADEPLVLSLWHHSPGKKIVGGDKVLGQAFVPPAHLSKFETDQVLDRWFPIHPARQLQRRESQKLDKKDDEEVIPSGAAQLLAQLPREDSFRMSILEEPSEDGADMNVQVHIGTPLVDSFVLRECRKTWETIEQRESPLQLGMYASADPTVPALHDITVTKTRIKYKNEGGSLAFAFESPFISDATGKHLNRIDLDLNEKGDMITANVMSLLEDDIGTCSTAMLRGTFPKDLQLSMPGMSVKVVGDINDFKILPADSNVPIAWRHKFAKEKHPILHIAPVGNPAFLLTNMIALEEMLIFQHTEKQRRKEQEKREMSELKGYHDMSMGIQPSLIDF